MSRCRPLNPIFNTLCPAGSAACREVGSSTQSLGVAKNPPVYNQVTKEVTLTYDLGQACKSHPSYNTSTVIIFKCEPGLDRGTPHLVNVAENCQYLFVWKTNLVCPENDVEKETVNCTYYDQRTDSTYDISALKDFQEVMATQGGKFSIQACGALPTNLSDQCRDAAVCLMGSRGLGSKSLLDGSFGRASTGVFSMDEENLKLTFTGGQICQHNTDNRATTNIIFECDYAAGNGKPEALPHFYCELNFKWRTSLVCPALIEDCAVSFGDTTFDLTILSQSQQSWMYIHSDGTKYWLNLCQEVHGEAHKQKCPPNSAACRQSKNGQVDMLGHKRTQKLSVTDDGTVVVEYSQGSSACSHSRRRSINALASTIIRLTCGDTVGAPILKSSIENQENCMFEFTWQTRVVCAKDSMPQELKDINQVIQDPRSGGTIDLRTLLNHGNRYTFDGKFSYLVSLEGHLLLNHSNPATSACIGAAICQQLDTNPTFQQNLGSFASRKYYLNEDKLEVVFTSPSKCLGKYSNKSMSSIITFSCNPRSDQLSNPVFSYMTADCTYIFSWDHPAACIQAKMEVVSESSISKGTSVSSAKASHSDISGQSSSINKATLAAIISIFSVVLAVCLLAVYFHRPERRLAAASKVKRFFVCQKNTENQIQYSVLSQMDEDPEVEEAVGGNPFEEEENELQNGDPFAPKHMKTAKPRNFHDDSDDDMLL